jgi:ATP-dependent protease HslVU (ClpYQ) ATPase subunit
MNNSTRHEAKTGGVPNRGSLYAVAAAHSKDAIEILYDLMKNSKNDGIRLGAAKAILNKTLPDLKQSEISEENDSSSPEFEDMVKKLRKGYLRPDQVFHEMSPEYQEMMVKITNRMSEAELFEKFSPGMVEWILKRRSK